MKKNTTPGTLTLLALVVLCLALVCAPASAQNAPVPYVDHHPMVAHAIHFDVSAPLRDMVKETPPRFGFHQANPVRRPKLQLMLAAAKRGEVPGRDGAWQRYVGPLISAVPGLNLLGVGIGFMNYFPPDAPTDVNLAVGATQVVQWVNVSYAVFDKTSGAVVLGPVLGNQLWSGFGGSCETQNDGDIIAQYDKAAGRWLLAQNVFAAPYMTCVAVSETSDATGSYFRYAFPQNNGFPDYPKWGVWSDGYYQHNNAFGGPNGFGSEPCAYDRAKMLVGDPTAEQICFQAPTTFDDGLLPADIDSSLPPPPGEPEIYLGSIDNTPPNGNVIYEYLFHVDFANPNNSTLTGFGGTIPVNVSTFGLACGGFGTCIPQEGIPDQLDSLGDRLMYRLAYRNVSFKGTNGSRRRQILLVSHSVTSPTGQVGMRWYQFAASESNTNLRVLQQSTFAPDSNFRWMGSIAQDKVGDILMGYSESSSTMFPSINYTGRTNADPLNTMETEATIVAGTGSQQDTANRWGDYTSMALDSQDGCTFWYTNQYYMTTGSFAWSTNLSSFKFPSCH